MNASTSLSVAVVNNFDREYSQLPSVGTKVSWEQLLMGILLGMVVGVGVAFQKCEDVQYNIYYISITKLQQVNILYTYCMHSYKT